MPEVRVLTNITVQQGDGDDYAEQWSPEYEMVNGQPGCIQFELFRSVRQPDTFALLEHWESRGAFYSSWLNNVMRPVAGEDLYAARPETEIYWRRKLYVIQGEAPAPADGERAKDDVEHGASPVRVVLNLNVQPGMADAYAQAWLSHFEMEPGCLQLDLLQSTRNPDYLALLALWQDRDSFDEHARKEPSAPRPEREFAGAPTERKVGASGLEIYFQQQLYAWDGDDWKAVTV